MYMSYYYYYTWHFTYRICYKISLCLVLFEADTTNVQTVDESHSDSHVYPDRTQTHIASSQRDKNYQQHHFLGHENEYLKLCVCVWAMYNITIQVYMYMGLWPYMTDYIRKNFTQVVMYNTIA